MPRPDSSPAAAATTPAAPRSRYSLGTMPNMLRSLLVIGALMTLVIFLVPRSNSLSGPVVDVQAKGREVVRDTGWPVVAPEGLPAGWRATAVRFVPTTGGANTWLAGYATPKGAMISVEQTMDASSTWIEKEINRAARTGTMTIDGREWARYERENKLQNSLVHRPDAEGELTTLVTGTASFEEMEFFITRLRPITPAS